MERGYCILNIPKTKEALENVYAILGDHMDERQRDAFIQSHLDGLNYGEFIPYLWDKGGKTMWFWEWNVDSYRVLYEKTIKLTYPQFLDKFFSAPLKDIYD